MMKKVMTTVLLVALAVVGGCSGVLMNAHYSTLLDKTVALSDETLARWDSLDPNAQRSSFAGQNAVLHRIQDARNGQEGK